MSAYATPVEKPRCHTAGCPKMATHRVFNTRNGEVGAYCALHAKLVVRLLDTADVAHPQAQQHRG